MLETINKIRGAFGLSPIDRLSEGETNRQVIENSLSLSANLKFYAGTNFIEVEGNLMGQNQKLVNALDEIVRPGGAWATEDSVSFWTPNDIRNFLNQ